LENTKAVKVQLSVKEGEVRLHLGYSCISKSPNRPASLGLI